MPQQVEVRCRHCGRLVELLDARTPVREIIQLLTQLATETQTICAVQFATFTLTAQRITGRGGVCQWRTP